MKFFGAVFLAGFAYAQLAHATDRLVVAPGHSVTLVDASDPGMHVVITAPKDAQLDLSRLLQANGKTSILSIVTAAQVKQAGELVANPDGSVSIALPADAAPAVDTHLGDSAVLVFDAGRYVGIAEHARLATLPSVGIGVAFSESVNVGAIVSASAARTALASPAASSVLPSASSVTAGSAAISSTLPSSLNPASKGTINWQPFAIGSGGALTITSSGASSLSLNGVTGQSGTIQVTSPTGVSVSGSIAAGTTGFTTGVTTSGSSGLTLK